MRIALILTLLATAGLLSACETLKGMGRDITNTGEAIDRKI